MKNIILALVFLSTTASLAADRKARQVNVRADRIKVHEEVYYTPHSVGVEKPASDIHVGETLGKLPGVVVRNYSGPGSLTTVTTPYALGSGSVGVSIDDIPIINPTGAGINFSLFPHTLFESMELRSGFYPGLFPTSVSIPAPGGRINLQTLGQPTGDELPVRASIMVGSANTIQGAAAYRGGDKKRDWVVGGSGFNTNGRFRFRHPVTGRLENRKDNDAFGAGALAKYKWKFKEKGHVELLNLTYRLHRTNPGRLDFPTQEPERDTFNLTGLSYLDYDVFTKNSGLFGKLSNTYSKTKTYSASTVDTIKTLGNFAQTGFLRKTKNMMLTIGIDNKYDDYRGYNQDFVRNVTGPSGSLAVKIDKVQLIPTVRHEVFTGTDNFDDESDVSFSVLYNPTPRDDISLSVGYQHIYPAITALTGYTAGGFEILANKNLRTQRDTLGQLSYHRRTKNIKLLATTFYDFVRNRPTFTQVFVNRRMKGQFVNVPKATIVGGTIDMQVYPVKDLTLRGSTTYTRAWDRSEDRDLPYKPRYDALLSVSYMVAPKVGVTVEEHYQSKQFVSTSGVNALPNYLLTNFRLNVGLWDGVAFFKVSNVFEHDGLVTDGYPIAGRSFWLGYRI